MDLDVLSNPLSRAFGYNGVGMPSYIIEIVPASEVRSLLADGDLSTVLSREEAAVFASIENEKRRLDRLAGRLAAKKAIQNRLSQAFNMIAVFPDIEIFNEPSGAPYLRLRCDPRNFNSAIPFSISHGASGGLCAVSLAPGRIGADWETIRALRTDAFALYAHPEEQKEFSTAEAQTRLWASKEAVSKFLGRGLALLDPREIRIAEKVVLEGAAKKRWEEIGSPAIGLDAFTIEKAVVAVAHEAATTAPGRAP